MINEYKNNQAYSGNNNNSIVGNGLPYNLNSYANSMHSQLSNSNPHLLPHQTMPQQSFKQNFSNSSIPGQNSMIDDLDSDGEQSNKSGSERKSGRRKIKIEYIQDKSRRHITFSKRKAGIMKKAYELSTLTGTQILLLVVSETGLVYTFTTPKLQPLVTQSEGKNLIQSCLNAPDTESANAKTSTGAYDNHNLQESPYQNNANNNNAPTVAYTGSNPNYNNPSNYGSPQLQNLNNNNNGSFSNYWTGGLNTQMGKQNAPNNVSAGMYNLMEHHD